MRRIPKRCGARTTSTLPITGLANRREASEDLSASTVFSPVDKCRWWRSSACEKDPSDILGSRVRLRPAIRQDADRGPTNFAWLLHSRVIGTFINEAIVMLPRLRAFTLEQAGCMPVARLRAQLSDELNLTPSMQKLLKESGRRAKGRGHGPFLQVRREVINKPSSRSVRS